MDAIDVQNSHHPLIYTLILKILILILHQSSQIRTIP